jgi:NFACT protein C-terminal domain
LLKNDDEHQRTAGRKSKEQKNKEESKWKQELVDEGVVNLDADTLDGEAVDDTLEISKLTGKPHPEDLLLFAVPVCAPYQTLSQYSYRVKLTPGNMKRGKASKQCIDLFLRTNGAKNSPGIERQLELIRKVPDTEFVQVLCADVKIAAAGASKAVKLAKDSSKNSKKSN